MIVKTKNPDNEDIEVSNIHEIFHSYHKDCECEPMVQDYVISISMLLNHAVRALQAIKMDAGKVCENFELCVHPSCKSSYSAWITADHCLSLMEKRGLI